MINENDPSIASMRKPSILVVEENETDVFLTHQMFELLRFSVTLVWKPTVAAAIDYLNQKFYRSEQLEDVIILSLDLEKEELDRFMERFDNLHAGLKNPPLLFGLGTFTENPELDEIYRYPTFYRVQNKPLSVLDVEKIRSKLAERHMASTIGLKGKGASASL